MTFAVFFSYSRVNQAIARKAVGILESSGLRTFLDVTGDQLTEEIKRAIAASACLVVYLSPSSAISNWVRKEIDLALELGKRIIVLRQRSTPIPAAWPSQLQDAVTINAGAAISQAAGAQLVSDVNRVIRHQKPVISVINIKGGVGKTTLCAHLFGCIAHRHRLRVLLIDLDPQHNLSQLMIPEKRLESAWAEGKSVLTMFEPRFHGRSPPSAGDWLNVDPSGAPVSPRDVRIPLAPLDGSREQFDLVAGHFESIRYGLGLSRDVKDGVYRNFWDFLSKAKNEYDCIVLDLNPGASALTEYALRASTHILAPVRPDRFSRRGLTLLDGLLNRMAGQNPPARIGIVNGYLRSGNPATTANEADILVEVDTTWPMLKARIAQSEYLRARQVQAPPGDDYTYWLAHRRWGIGGGGIKSELEAAADELREGLGL
jgi:chromosome partitioning protein